MDNAKKSQNFSEMKTEVMSRSKKIAAKTMYRAFQLLKSAGGEMPVKDIKAEIENSVDFSDWEKAIYEKTGNVRWVSVFYLYSIDFVKAGYLRKSGGVWALTEEGEKALELEPNELLESAIRAYRLWQKENRPAETEEALEDALEESKEKLLSTTLDDVEQRALESLRTHILAKNPYEFQDLVAALLRGMGYYTPHVAPRGKDGGMDIIAYQDPLGAKSPRIIVQVKHRPSTKSTVEEIRELKGLLANTGDIGLFVSSGDFTQDAKKESRNTKNHIELIDFTRFISLWTEFYSKMTDEDKGHLPLKAIFFLSPEE